MLCLPRVGRASRNITSALPCVKNQAHLPEFQTARRDSVHRPSEICCDLRVRGVREEPEGAKNFFLFRAEVLRSLGVCPE